MNEEVRLVLDPDTIRMHAKKTFAKILRKYNTTMIDQNEFWNDIYRPKEEFIEHIDTIIDEINLGEWHQTLKLVNTNSALGPSSIEYTIIKQFSDNSSFILLKLINLSLELGFVPDQ